MSVLLLEEPWARQPHVAVGPPSAGPYADPTVLWNAQFPFLNLVDRSRCLSAYLGTGLSIGNCRYGGKELVGTSLGTGRVVFNTPPEQTEITIAVLLRGASTTSNQRFWSNYVGAGTGIFDCYFDASVSTYTANISRAANTQYRLTGLPTFASGAIVLIMYANNTVRAWYNGNEISTTVAFVGSGSRAAPSTICSIAGRFDSTTRQLGGGVAMLARYDRALSSVDALALSRVGAMQRLAFAPQELVLPGYLAAGGPPTLAAITASNITATGARLTVTV